MSLTAEERRLRARAAAFALHAKRDPRETSRAGREAFRRRFLEQVDPRGELPAEERERRAARAIRSYMLTLALKSAKARRERREGR